MMGYRGRIVVSVVVAVTLAVALGSYLAFAYPAEATGAASVGATLSIQVINGSTLSPIAGISLFAGPTTSPSDVVATPAGPTLMECVHGVPSGSSVDNNGSVLFPNGTVVTFPSCPLNEYATDSSGLVLIENVTSEYYFVRIGGFMQQNEVIIGHSDTNLVHVTIPWPTGNATLPESGLPSNCRGNQSTSASGVEILYEACSS
jgi:hypothetical protein